MADLRLDARVPSPTPPPLPAHLTSRVRTGIAGLDEILRGGLPRDRLYLVDGEPGSGKTTLALQFLLAGAAEGESGLYVTLSETADELRAVAASHGWSLDGIDIFELSSSSEDFSEAYTLFHPAEVELQQTVGAVFEAVEQKQARRVVFDSLSEMRMLAHDPLRFRRQILALKQFFAGRECTVLVLDDRTSPEGDLQLQSIAHGVILLEHSMHSIGAERRRILVKKLRGAQYIGGLHDFRIKRGGLEVYPRIVANPIIDPAAAAAAVDERVGSGSQEIDALLGGGIARGTSLLLIGAAGTGKSVLALQFATAAAERGETASIYLFDERIGTAIVRSRGIGIDLAGHVERGQVRLRQIEPVELTAGEFASLVAADVVQHGATLVVLDSLNGFLQAMPDEQSLVAQVYELLSYLTTRGVTVLLTLVQRGLFGGAVDEVADVSYLADAVVLLRYFEHAGAVRQAISVVKKRSGAHERTIRECKVARGGLRLGAPLEEFRGVLTGVPEYTGDASPLMRADRGSESTAGDVPGAPLRVAVEHAPGRPPGERASAS